MRVDTSKIPNKRGKRHLDSFRIFTLWASSNRYGKLKKRRMKKKIFISALVVLVFAAIGWLSYLYYCNRIPEGTTHYDDTVSIDFNFGLFKKTSYVPRYYYI